MSDEEEDSSSKWEAVEESEAGEDDDEDAGTEKGRAAAKQTLKDLINVTNFADDAAAAADEEDDDADNYDGVIKVVDGETVFQQQQNAGGGGGGTSGPSSSSNNGNPFQKVVDQTVTSIRGSMTEHVAPKLESFVKETQQGMKKIGDSIRSGHEQHVVPLATKANQGIQEFGQTTKKGLDEFGQNTKKTMDGIGQNTKKVVETHVLPHVATVKQVSVRTLKEVETSSREFTTKHIQPHLEEAQRQSQHALEETSRFSSRTYTTTTTYIYNNRHFFWNSAPALACDVGSFQQDGTTSSTSARLDWKQLYLLFEESTARSFGQVVYCNNPITGLFVWLAILWSSPLAALCSLICVGTTNMAAIYFDLDREILRQGLFGFNAVLIGTSLVDYFEFDFMNVVTGYPDKLHGWIILIFLSIVLAPFTLFVKLYLQHNVLKPSTPVVLLPFNLIMLLVLLSAKIWDDTMLSQVVLADEGLVDGESAYTAASSSRYFGYQAVFNGVSRIFLIDGVGPGVLILAGVFLCSRILFASLVGGTFFASLVGLSVFGDHMAYLNAGYAGFNPALAVAGIFYFMVPSWKLTGVAFFWVFITMIITSAVNVILDAMTISVAMSIGFCLAVIPLLSLDMQSVFPETGGGAFMRRIPLLELSTPEEYLQLIAPSPADKTQEDEAAADIACGGGDDEEDSDDDDDDQVASESTPLLV